VSDQGACRSAEQPSQGGGFQCDDTTGISDVLMRKAEFRNGDSRDETRY
jgi:hypothetical protein